MLTILSRTFMTATHLSADKRTPHSHWPRSERFDNRRNAEIEAHLHGVRR